MSTTVRDNFLHSVLGEMIELEARSFYFKSLWQDMRDEMGDAESMDLGEWAGSLNVEDHVNTATKAHNALTVQEMTDAKNPLVIDTARGLAVELKNWDKKFNRVGGASYVRRFAARLLLALRNDRDTRDNAYLANVAAWQSGTTTPLTHVNPAGAALTFNMVETAITRMHDKEGVQPHALAFMVSAFGKAHFRALPEFVANMTGDKGGNLGGPGLQNIGSIEGIPIFMGQGIQRGRSVAVSASERLGDELIMTVPSGHGFVVGMKVTSTGAMTIKATNATVTEVDATHVHVANVGADAAGNGAGTLAEATSTAHNLLVNTERLWQASDPIATRIVPTGSDKTSDTFQAWEDYGKRARLDPSSGEGDEGTAIVIHTANGSINVA